MYSTLLWLWTLYTLAWSLHIITLLSSPKFAHRLDNFWIVSGILVSNQPRHSENFAVDFWDWNNIINVFIMWNYEPYMNMLGFTKLQGFMDYKFRRQRLYI